MANQRTVLKLRTTKELMHKEAAALLRQSRDMRAFLEILTAKISANSVGERMLYGVLSSVQRRPGHVPTNNILSI